MKKLLIILIFVPLVSFGQNNIYSVTSEGGLNVRDKPGIDGEKIAILLLDDLVYLLEKTEIPITVTDLSKSTGRDKKISGQWVKIKTHTPPKLKVDKILRGNKDQNIEGYVFDGFLKRIIKTFYKNGKLKMEGGYADIDSLEFLLGKVIWDRSGSNYYQAINAEKGYAKEGKILTGIEAYKKLTEKPIKDGKWTYYYESGIIEKEEFYEVNLFLKEKYYSEKGFKTSEIEYYLKEGELLPTETKYYENGTIKSINSEDYEGRSYSEYYNNGNKKYVSEFGAGTGFEKYYYKNGKVKKMRISEDNFSLIEEYSEVGKLTKEEIYLNTELQDQFKDGIWIFGKDRLEKDYQLDPPKDGRLRYYKKIFSYPTPK